MAQPRSGLGRALGDLADPEISRTLEPRAPAARKRLAAVKALAEAGVPAWVAIAPVVPGITDHELEHIVEAAAEAGANGVFYLPVRLPFEVAPLFRAWLDEHFPDRADKVMHIIQLAARRQGQRPQLVQPDARLGPLGGPAQGPVRARGAASTASTPTSARCARDLFEPPQGPQLRLL